MADTFVAGHYAATWNTVDIGTTREGFRLLETFHAEMIVTDDYGDVPVDAIRRGVESRVQLDYSEYIAIAKTADALYAQVGGQANMGNSKGKVGLPMVNQTAESVTKVLVLTALAGTPAAAFAGGILTLTANDAIVISDIETLLASRLRQGPCTFQLFPNPADGKAYIATHGA
jgi:hypothetical protein